MRLFDALRVESASRISLVGAGGKTSALLRLGFESEEGAILAATAHLGINQAEFFGKHIIWEPEEIPDISIFPIHQKCVITGPRRDNLVLFGVDPPQWKYLKQLGEKNHLPVILESDGSKTRPIKAPAAHEPPIPGWVNHVVVSVGLSILDKKLNNQNVHRPELFSKLTGLRENQPITETSIIAMLNHAEGGLKNIPAGARKTVLFNQADTLENMSLLQEFSDGLLGKFDSIVFSSLQGNEGKYYADERPGEVVRTVEKIAGIILAAGNSKRMGQSKALLDWRGNPFVRAVALEAISAGLDPVIIIVGSDATLIQAALHDLPVKVVKNPEWQTGQSSSIHVGLKSLPVNVGGAVFQLVDQPQIPQTLIRQLVLEHSLSLAPIILPESGGRRANPGLFDRKVFPDLMKLQGDIGGRGIFSHFPLRTIPWNDEVILLDVDTPEDYQNLISYTK